MAEMSNTSAQRAVFNNNIRCIEISATVLSLYNQQV